MHIILLFTFFHIFLQSHVECDQHKIRTNHTSQPDNKPDLITSEGFRVFKPKNVVEKKEDNETFLIVLQETICYKDECYWIVDRLFDYGNGPVYSRLLQEKTAYSTGMITTAKLMQEKKIDGTNQWKVQSEILLGNYAKVMTAVSFITYALAQNHSGNLLMIGLGGSSLNNFLAQFSDKLNITVVELNPAMKFISTRWFDLQESSSHHVIIDDGVKYLENNIKNPLKFDIIFLDACFNMLTDGTLCPVDVFQEENIIRMIQQNLGTSGILTMNVAISREDDENFLKNLAFRYEKYFEKCFYCKINDGQYILTCSKESFQTVSYHSDYYRRYNESVPFELQEMLYEKIQIKNY